MLHVLSIKLKLWLLQFEKEQYSVVLKASNFEIKLFQRHDLSNKITFKFFLGYHPSHSFHPKRQKQWKVDDSSYFYFFLLLATYIINLTLFLIEWNSVVKEKEYSQMVFQTNILKKVDLFLIYQSRISKSTQL